MRVLIGIPSFRRPEMLRELLGTIAGQTGLAALQPEIFVADNDAAGRDAVRTCESLSAAFPFPLAAAAVAEKGIAANRNHILAEARSRGVDLLVMVDDDERVTPGWLAALVAAHIEYGAAVIGGPVLYLFPRETPDHLRDSAAFPLKRRPSGPMPLLTAGGNMLVDCRALESIGWPMFDPAFGLTGGEDKEWFTRLKHAGLGFAWADDAVAEEHMPVERITLRSILARAYAIGGSDYRIDAAHGPSGACLRHLARSGVVLLLGVATAPLLAFARWRMSLLRRQARALGRIAAALGRSRQHYGRIDIALGG